MTALRKHALSIWPNVDVSQLLPKAKTLATADANAREAIKEKLRRLADHTQQAVLLSQGTGSRTQVELRAKVQINTVLHYNCPSLGNSPETGHHLGSELM